MNNFEVGDYAVLQLQDQVPFVIIITKCYANDNYDVIEPIQNENLSTTGYFLRKITWASKKEELNDFVQRRIGGTERFISIFSERLPKYIRDSPNYEKHKEERKKSIVKGKAYLYAYQDVLKFLKTLK